MNPSPGLGEAIPAASLTEARLAAIVEIAHDAIVSLDAQHRITLFNRGAETLFGWSAEDAIGRPIDILLPRDVVGVHRRHVERFAQADVTARQMGERAEIRGRRRDGTEFPAEASISKVVIEGEPAYTVILHDVTERHRVEQALREAEARRQAAEVQAHLAAVVASSDDAIVSTSLDGTIASWNAGAEQVFGYAASDAVGAHLSLVVPAERNDDSRALLARVAAGNSVVHHETTHRRQDGTDIDISLTISPIRAPDGSVVGAAATARDITERKRAEAQLHHQALHDALTGLPNRALLGDRLERALTRAQRTGGEVAVLFLDLDHFKVVNDSRGHPAGDAVLEALAGRLRAAVRPADTVARFGGDEFVIVCEDAGHWEASLLARRIAEHLEVPVDLNGTSVVLTASIGIAVGTAGEDPDGLIRDADAAMYHAKDRGRSRTEIFDSAMHARTERRLSMEAALRQALAQGELRVAYQPIISLADGRLAGAEALLRWDGADPSWASPATFIPVAESCGLIEPIGTWVLEEVGRQLRDWEPLLAASPEFSVSVNVSPHQLGVRLFDALLGLVRGGLDPRRLSLELTETVLMDDADSSVEALVGLKAIGMRLAIDDFGTGYSSLSYLRRFPIDTLKIDQSFVHGLGGSANDVAIVGAVVAMARSLGIAVVAEGVETAADLEELKNLGCEMGQGFFWRPALNPDELGELLSASAPVG